MNTEGIIGHQRQLKNLEFLLKSKNIPQAILFSGTNGIGKSLIARRFLNALFCKDKNPPCLTCSICRQFAGETFPDFVEIYPNEKGVIPIGSENNYERGSIRWLIQRSVNKSISGRYGVIINGMDRVTEEGQNALLKTIEEPASGTCIILICANRNYLLPTILSRCLEIKYLPLTDSNLRDILSEKFVQAGNSGQKEFDLFIKLSCGSVEIVNILSDKSSFKEIAGICRAISDYFKGNSIIESDKIAVKDIRTDLLLDIIINIYRLNLLNLLKNENAVHPELKDIFLDDENSLMQLIKILMHIKRNESHNINIKFAVKGMLYNAEKENNGFLFSNFPNYINR